MALRVKYVHVLSALAMAINNTVYSKIPQIVRSRCAFKKIYKSWTRLVSSEKVVWFFENNLELWLCYNAKKCVFWSTYKPMSILYNFTSIKKYPSSSEIQQIHIANSYLCTKFNLWFRNTKTDKFKFTYE